MSLHFQRWTDHPQAASTLEALRIVERLKPRGGIWENVMGFNQLQEGADRTPMKMVTEELASMGFMSQPMVVCASSFQALVRRRPAQVPSQASSPSPPLSEF